MVSCGEESSVIEVVMDWVDAARQKDRATESVSELVGAFKKAPPVTPVTPIQPITGDGFISPLSPSPYPYSKTPVNRRSSATLAGLRSQKLSGVSELVVEPIASSRSKRTSGFLSLLGYSIDSQTFHSKSHEFI